VSDQQPVPEQPNRPSRRPLPGVCIGRPFGVPVYVAPSWFLVAAILTYAVAANLPDHYGLTTLTKYSAAAVFVLLLYGSVLIHELSHTVVARILGLPVRRIVLMLIGGVSELEREPKSAGSEYLVAMAGPVVSIFLAGVSGLAAKSMTHDSIARLILAEIAVANLVVAFFNLLPGLPLDGGRVMRAVVWRFTHDQARGTLGAARTGRALAVAVAATPVVLSVVLDEDHRPGGFVVLWFLVVGWFLWAGAGQSIRVVQLRQRLPRIRVGDLARRALTVPVDVPLAEALRRAGEIGARGIVTIDSEGKPSGLVSEAAVAATPEQRRPWVSVGSLARRVEPQLVLDAELRGQAVLDAIASTPASEYLVLDGDSGKVCGVLATADVARAMNSG
jgi:Zn-dependent protease/CBS domain-containing protein